MATSNTTTYIKKLVRIVYDKEKQIEKMKRALKDQTNEPQENPNASIHPFIQK